METQQLTFQQAMVRLDEIVRQLNSGNLELEKAMELFEEGLKLTQQCEVQLKAFENKMNTLIVETAGNA
ncbi:exodeoxyribonuclease VII small subunit [Faecalibaculum rodentium]|jgi:exodeoxyribonuclease VII small subunit|uniref:Exodeoxyribonuclease 7 small subunit n=1 Tax=Faecalibaculum rodentium TaxID=1702221 RepID=A0A140DUP4_9FIRM|nr:exodeoxyribonuclease VII small subunit [Faecalibaculum rodentium]AMK54371.1 exodeoxyribonuclease VII, small subunit [Faecalibaculum rodentium]OLU45141.1 exodeoxyribonuclease VII small subunit [Faecalibaculum rodentium]